MNILESQVPVHAVLFVLLNLVLGCSTTRQSALEEESGFLSDYPSLSRDDEAGGHSWARSGWRLNEYDGIFVPEVELRVGAAGSRLDAENASRLADLFRKRTIEKLERFGWKLAAEPEAGTLTLRLALTELDGANPYGSVLTSIPYPSTGALQVLALTADLNVFVGEVSTEVQVVDSSTGEVLAEGMDRRVGAHSFLNIGSTWGDVHDAMGVWASRIGNGLSKLDEAR